MNLLFWKKAEEQRERMLGLASAYAKTDTESIEIAWRFDAFIRNGSTPVKGMVASPRS